MFRRSRNIKAHQPIAAAVDNRGDSLSDTSCVDPLVGKVICTVCTVCSSHLEAMSGDESTDSKGGPLESVSSFEDTLIGMAGGALPVLNNIWECPLINMSVREEDNGVHSNGWTCGHCPMPARGPPHFHKHVNASKALAHVLKLKGQSVSACKGNIPYAKKVQYKALYNAGRLKSKLSKRRKEELDYDIAESQAKTVATHFPASTSDQRKRPFEYDGGGGASQQYHQFPLQKRVGEVLRLRRHLFSLNTGCFKEDPPSNHHNNDS